MPSSQPLGPHKSRLSPLLIQFKSCVQSFVRTVAYMYFKSFTSNIIRHWFCCTPGKSFCLFNKCKRNLLDPNTSFVLRHWLVGAVCKPLKEEPHPSGKWLALMCPPRFGPESLFLSPEFIYLSALLANLSSGLIWLFVSVPGASAECRVACDSNSNETPLRPVKPLTFSVTSVADKRGLSCKLRDPELNKSVCD